MKNVSFYFRPAIFLSLFCFLFVSAKVYSQTKIIKTGDNWFYFDKSNVPPHNWNKTNEPNDQWLEGPSPLGYGDTAVKTEINFGDNSENKHITKYFTKKIRLENPYEYLVYSLNVNRDDGIVVYLNGREVMRNNMPEGEITNTTKASSLVIDGEAEKFFHKILLLPDDFNIGINTISASVHKARETSIDCIFNLELIGENNLKMIPLLIKERSIKNLSIEAKLKEQNYKHELETRDLKSKLLEQSKNNLKTFFYSIFFLLVILIVILLYIYKTLSSKNKKLDDSLNLIKEQNASKDKAMITNSLNQLNNQQFLKELKTEFEQNINNDITSLKIWAKKAINQIDYNIGTNDDWENLKKHFNAVHSGYYDKLIKLHPSLSEIELRHCIFIKLHLHTKEIANILHIDPKSVQASRYRIKKKIKLSEDVDLRDYLLNI